MTNINYLFNTKNKLKKKASLFLSILFPLFLLVALSFIFINNINAASTWQKYPANPIAGPLDSWGNAYNPTVIFRDNFFKLWFEGNRGSGSMIGYSYSPNGINNWTTINSPILQRGSNNGWESETANANVTFNKQLNIYQMWYTSLNVSHWNVGLDRFRLRYATSTDGINWDRQNGWSSTIGADAWASSTSWDKGGIARGISVIYKDGIYHLWYAGTNENNLAINPYWRIGYATSMDGINWTKQNNGNPVIVPTKSWELNNVSYPNVLYENGKYKMWYAAGLGDSGNQIVYATSTDGIIWDKPENENPVLTRSPSGFDSGNIISPFVMKDGKIYKMWYSGFGNTGSGYAWRIGYATKSADLILDVPNLKQIAEPWQDDTYDSANIWNPANSTINRWGCALTSAAMILRYHGINLLPDETILDPGSLNTWLNNEEDGYVGDGYINWLAVSRLSRLARDTNNITDFEALEYIRLTEQDDTQLTEDLNNSRPDILQEPGHFIVAKGIGDDTFYINDPYYDRTDLNSYNDTYLSLGRYVPSNTNLSYIMLTTSPEIQIAATNAENKFIGNQFTEQPLVTNGINSNMKPIKTFYIPKPKKETYKIQLSSVKTKVHEIKVYLYDTQGNVNIIKQNIVLGANNPEFLEIKFDPEKLNSSILEKLVTFQSIIRDIKEGQSLKLINKAVANNLISIITNAEKDYKKGRKNLVLLRFNSFETLLNSTRRIGVDEKAYQILMYDIKYLKTQL